MGLWIKKLIAMQCFEKGDVSIVFIQKCTTKFLASSLFCIFLYLQILKSYLYIYFFHTFSWDIDHFNIWLQNYYPLVAWLQICMRTVSLNWTQARCEIMILSLLLAIKIMLYCLYVFYSFFFNQRIFITFIFSESKCA